eukprot:TRINITY_DN10977_c0_g1_i5.p1 TRINITY_DN10977_c0_g1~~TRINITY_DN10977_c0_g1_i5.p1  ORF type:complete len:363 (-),score=131.48 TRINITY_DN10977_c0_g1_i5:352-1395(-)
MCIRDRSTGIAGIAMDDILWRLEQAWPSADPGLLIGVLENSDGNEDTCRVHLAEMLGPPQPPTAQPNPPLSNTVRQEISDYGRSLTTPRVMGAVVARPAVSPTAQNGVTPQQMKKLQDGMKASNQELVESQQLLLQEQQKRKEDKKTIADLKRQLAEAQGAPDSPKMQSGGMDTADSGFSSSLLDAGLSLGASLNQSEEPQNSGGADLEQKIAELEEVLCDECERADAATEQNVVLQQQVKELEGELAGAQAVKGQVAEDGARISELERELAEACSKVGELEAEVAKQKQLKSESALKLKKELQQKTLALEDAHEQLRSLQGELAAGGDSTQPKPAEDEIDDFFDGK